MSLILLLFVALLLYGMEKKWAPAALKALSVRSGCGRVLVEPGEIVTWQATVENHGRLPVPFVRLRQQFPLEAAVAEDKVWVATHCKTGIQQWSAEEKLSLRGSRSRTRTVRLSFPRRGAYRLGNYRLSAGDLLGLREEGRDGEGQTLVVMPARAENRDALRALGGFLGEVSVRRFILEDPVLTVGFRDYTGREPLKDVSWTRTARAGMLQVKQYDHTAEQTVTVLLNTEGGTPEELEGCFRLARSVCERLEKEKIPFALRTNGDLPGPLGKVFFLAEGLGDVHLNTILYALGRANYLCYHSFRYLVEQTLRHRRNNESYVVITPSAEYLTGGLMSRLESAAGGAVCMLAGRSEAERL